jgi:hypothetical protein
MACVALPLPKLVSQPYAQTKETDAMSISTGRLMRALPISSRSMGKQCEVSVERDLHGVIEQGSLAFLACACRPASRAHPRHNRRLRCQELSSPADAVAGRQATARA